MNGFLLTKYSNTSPTHYTVTQERGGNTSSGPELRECESERLRTSVKLHLMQLGGHESRWGQNGKIKLNCRNYMTAVNASNNLQEDPAITFFIF